MKQNRKSEVKKFLEVINLWAARYDTREIQLLTGVPECEVERWIHSIPR